MGSCDFDQIFKLQTLKKPSSPRDLRTGCRTNFSTAFPQAILGGTRLTGVGGARNQFLNDFFFVTVGFVYSR